MSRAEEGSAERSTIVRGIRSMREDDAANGAPVASEDDGLPKLSSFERAAILKSVADSAKPSTAVSNNSAEDDAAADYAEDSERPRPVGERKKERNPTPGRSRRKFLQR